MVLEAEDIFLGKARFKDWEAMYLNVWSRPETARFMMWEVTATWEEAKDRIKRTILFQETHDTYLIYEKKHGQAIGFAGEPRGDWICGQGVWKAGALPSS